MLKLVENRGEIGALSPAGVEGEDLLTLQELGQTHDVFMARGVSVA